MVGRSVAMARSPSARRARNLHVETRHHCLLRPGHLHLQLRGARPVQPRLRHRRPGARLRPGRRAHQPCQRRTPDRPCSPARPAGGMVAGDPRARRPPVGGHLPAARTGRVPGHRRANRQVQAKFSGLFNLGEAFPVDGRQFRAPVRGRRVVPHRRPGMPRAAYPGAYPGVHDLPGRRQRLRRRYLFMPDYGTARCDFPGGDARQLYRSIQRLFALPDATRLFMCHDYRLPAATSTAAKPASASSAGTTCTSAKASTRRRSSPCASSAMPPSACRP